MDFNMFKIGGPLEITPRRIADDRGYFCEILRLDKIRPHVGEVAFVQANESCSTLPGTIRGIHFQIPPAAQGKLVRCIAGSLFDVAVDLRSGSETFGSWIAATLTARAGNQLWIPPGFGHAYCTLEPGTILAYLVTAYYSPEHDSGIAWNDRDLAISWPEVANPATLSKKDRELSSFAALPKYF